jgi:hypothetical protein
LAVIIGACQGAVGKAGDSVTGATGPTGPTGPPGTPAVQNTPPAVKAGKTLATQHFALIGAELDGTLITGAVTGAKVLGEIKLSDYFEDAEGVLNLIYSVAELSAADKTIMEVYLTNMDPEPNSDDTGFVTGTNNVALTTSMAAVMGDAYLAIKALKAGSAMVTVTVKDGLPGGVRMQDISVMVRATNAPPAVSAALDMDALEAFDKTAADRLVVGTPVTVDLPAMAFVDPNGDTLTYEVVIGGDNADDIAANKKILDAAIDSSGDLVLTPKAPSTATGDGSDAIPVTIKATDPYGASAMTGTPIDVTVNRPPAHHTYTSSNLPTPSDKMGTDKVVLADLAVTTFSVASTTGDAATLLTLGNHFTDADSEDDLDDNNLANGVCNFASTDTDSTYATLAFNSGRTAIEIVGKKQGELTVTVTCEDTKKEKIEDSVTVTIIG